jgi:hypothetical protein
MAMKIIPTTETAQIIRTDFSDQTAWEKLTTKLQHPADPFIFNIEILDDHDYHRATVKQLLAALPPDYPHSFLVIADSMAISQSDYPLLIIDLREEPGRQFRAIATEVPSIDNNLSIANMDFADFSSAVDTDGVFRGFSTDPK